MRLLLSSVVLALAAGLLCLSVGASGQGVVLSPTTSNTATLSLQLNQQVNFTLDLTGLDADQLSRLEIVLESSESCQVSWQFYLEKYALWCGSSASFPNVVATSTVDASGYWPYWQPDGPIPAQIMATASSCFVVSIYAQLYPVVPLTRALGVQYTAKRQAPYGQLRFVFAEADSPANMIQPFAVVLDTESTDTWSTQFSVTPAPAASGYTESVTQFQLGQSGYLDSNACPHFQNSGGYGIALAAPVVLQMYGLRTPENVNMTYVDFDVSVRDETPTAINATSPSATLPVLTGVSTIFTVALNTTGVTQLLVTLTAGFVSTLYYTANSDVVAGSLQGMTVGQAYPLTLAQASPSGGTDWLLSFAGRNEVLLESTMNGTIVVQYVGAPQEEDAAAEEFDSLLALA